MCLYISLPKLPTPTHNDVIVLLVGTGLGFEFLGDLDNLFLPQPALHTMISFSVAHAAALILSMCLKLSPPCYDFLIQDLKHEQG